MTLKSVLPQDPYVARISMKLLGTAALSCLAGLALAGQTSIPTKADSAAPAEVSSISTKQQIKVEKRTPAYWRVTFDNPPFNIFGPETIPQMEKVVAEIETDPNLRVVVFDSDVPGFFLTHYNFTPPLAESTRLPSGPTGLH
ncbi:enoyl-CoA hydratase/isomerase family protein, partial [Rhizobium ruizarguesonis]